MRAHRYQSTAFTKQVGVEPAEVLLVSGRRGIVNHKTGQHEVLAIRQGSFGLTKPDCVQCTLVRRVTAKQVDVA